MRQAVSRVPPNYRPRNRRAWLCLVWWCLSALPVHSQVSNGTASAPESDLRAAVIVGILRFTQWTQAPISRDDGAAITICAWGNAPSVPGLENNSESIRIHDQEVLLRRPATDDDLQACPVVIWGRQANSTATVNSDALVICDTCDRNRVEAIVSLVRVNNRIHFEINLERARSAGINFSSDLLNLARHVEGL